MNEASAPHDLFVGKERLTAVELGGPSSVAEWLFSTLLLPTYRIDATSVPDSCNKLEARSSKSLRTREEVKLEKGSRRAAKRTHPIGGLAEVQLSQGVARQPGLA